MKAKNIAIISAVAVLAAGCGQVDSGETGIYTTWGKAEREPLDPGLHYVNPFCSEIVRYSTREQREEIKTATYTKDMQSAYVQLLVVFSVKREDAYNLHVTYGQDYKSKTVVPAVFGAVKDVLGQWEADKLVNGREKATKEIFDKATEMMSGQPVRLVSVTILNIDYSDAFEKAIEAKQIATQEAIKAKNRTVQIEEESRQEVIRAEAKAKAKLAIAEADAKAVEIRGKALKENPDVIKLEAIGKWDGKAPQTLILGSDSGTLVNVKGN